MQLIDLLPTVLELAGVDQTDLLLQGRSLVGLIDGEDPDYWRNRVVVVGGADGDAQERSLHCGSLYFRDWHVLSSSWMWPRDHLYAPDLQAFLTTSVLRGEQAARRDPGTGRSCRTCWVRFRQRAILGELREANMATWRKMTEGEGGNRVIDPDTLERLQRRARQSAAPPGTPRLPGLRRGKRGPTRVTDPRSSARCS